MKVRALYLCLICVLFLSGCTVSLTNDFFSGTDEDFTHGTEFNYNKRVKNSNKVLRSVAESLPDITLEEKKAPTHVNFKFGQHLYTPDDLRREDVIEDDNPYAGWLFSELKRQVLTKDQKREVGVTAGVIGKYSFAENVQKFVHNDLGKGTDPKGWDNQLGTEPGVIGTVNQSEVLFRVGPGGWEMDGIHGAEARLGNIHTDLSYGPKVRFGKNLPSFEGYDEDWSLYGYVGSNARLVGRNIFYDGNTFQDSHSVGSEPLVGDIVGGVITENSGWEFGLNYKFTTPEHQEREDGHSIWLFSVSKVLDEMLEEILE